MRILEKRGSRGKLPIDDSIVVKDMPSGSRCLITHSLPSFFTQLYVLVVAGEYETEPRFLPWDICQKSSLFLPLLFFFYTYNPSCISPFRAWSILSFPFILLPPRPACGKGPSFLSFSWPSRGSATAPIRANQVAETSIPLIYNGILFYCQDSGDMMGRIQNFDKSGDGIASAFLLASFQIDVGNYHFWNTDDLETFLWR